MGRHRMICVTGAELNVASLARRLADGASKACLHEIRLDALAPFDDAVFALCANPRVIATCRPRREGGSFEGAESDRLDLLRRAAAADVGYLDIELSTEPLLRRPLQQAPGGPKIILSWHAQSEEERPPWHRFEGEKADVLKLAQPISDAADLTHFLPDRDDERPTLRIATGMAGIASRALYDRFGSPWTYVAASPELATAPGQLSLEQARLWRVGQALEPLGLVGGDRVFRSPGPRIYNELFACLDWPFIYIPLLTSRPRALVPTLERLGFVGLSVTMPAKEILLPLAHRLDERASAVGAINTLLMKGGRREGSNTDVIAVERLLERFSGEAALVLGSGGAARAALGALKALGCPITLCARDNERAKMLAQRFRCAVATWSERVEQTMPIVVNGTSCGIDDAGSPLPEDFPWRKKVLLDAPLGTSETAFAHNARLSGARVFDGRAWWLEQALTQMETLLCRPLPRPLVEELLDD